MYLGHVISCKQITPNISKTQRDCAYPVPTDVDKVIHFLGLASYTSMLETIPQRGKGTGLVTLQSIMYWCVLVITIIYIILHLSVHACMRAYEQEVPLDPSLKFLFLGTAGLGHYSRQPTDTASNGPSQAKVSCFKRTEGTTRLKCTY